MKFGSHVYLYVYPFVETSKFSWLLFVTFLEIRFSGKYENKEAFAVIYVILIIWISKYQSNTLVYLSARFEGNAAATPVTDTNRSVKKIDRHLEEAKPKRQLNYTQSQHHSTKGYICITTYNSMIKRGNEWNYWKQCLARNHTGNFLFLSNRHWFDKWNVNNFLCIALGEMCLFKRNYLF